MTALTGPKRLQAGPGPERMPETPISEAAIAAAAVGAAVFGQRPAQSGAPSPHNATLLKAVMIDRAVVVAGIRKAPA